MLDDSNTISQRDPSDALGVAAKQTEQLTSAVEVQNMGESFSPAQIVVTGMGGSALAAGMVKNWLNLAIPFEVVRHYEVPAYVNENTLVIASSYSGNTEETLSALANAEMRGAKLAVIAAGGRLIEIAKERHYPYTQIPSGFQPRMAMLHNLRALVKLLEAFGVVQGAFDEIAANADWLVEEVKQWTPDVATADNYAKQLALEAAGKTPVVYAGSVMAPVAYDWKISFNENAKNVAFYNELPEFNHNEFLGWSSHPVEKPFVVFDLVSNFEHPQVRRRFEVSDRLLSGKRPHAITVNLKGDNMIGQMLWAYILSDFVSIYLGILNNVDPTPVDLADKLKKELAQA